MVDHTMMGIMIKETVKVKLEITITGTDALMIALNTM